MAVVTARHLRRLGLGVLHGAAAVVVLRAVVGPWVAAVVGAVVLVVALGGAWAKVESRVFDQRPDPGVVRGSGEGHVAFARALSTVAAAYLAECEQEARR